VTGAGAAVTGEKKKERGIKRANIREIRPDPGEQ
jgi:hypothetical protein